MFNIFQGPSYQNRKQITQKNKEQTSKSASPRGYIQTEYNLASALWELLADKALSFL